jgi:hypothetical protein
MGKFKEGYDARRNGGGRPKIPPEFKKGCREFTDTEVLAAWKEEVLTRGEHWMKAAELLAAYGHGRPTQQIEIDYDSMPDEELWRHMAEAVRLREQDKAQPVEEPIQ